MTLLNSTNPATGEIIWQKESNTPADVNAAVASARAAFPAWAKRPLAERVEILERYRDLLTENKAAMAEAIAMETGKPLWDALGEAGAMVGKVGISLKAYNERTGENSFDMGAGLTGHLTHRPHGVMAVFGPYNFPGHLPNGHIIPALIAGNTIVFKPSNMTPMVGEKMVDLMHEAGIPKDVVIYVQGQRNVGEALSHHKGIDGLLFTGSTHVGTILNKQLAGDPDKIIALEMGGNNPLIVWNPESPEAAAYHTVLSAFISTGQRCTCARRLILPKGAEGDAVLEALIPLAQNLKVGAYNEAEEPFMGPLIRQKEAEDIIAAQAELEKVGGQPLLKSTMPREGLPFITPGIMDVTNINNREDIEFFGPFLQVIRVADFDDAIAEANNTSYGLSSAIFTKDKALYERALLEVRAGLINWNRQTTGASGAMPFGGVGVSGNHRPAAYYASDYCAFPIASVESEALDVPETPAAGIVL
ncbi:MAG: succinylglutamate-semialdehyde dehydrogenase [Rickettsiales bacterium]|nr:succinylglutamate-semialdehyde dehydrogenase [Rickettsiales bacterium]